MVGKNFNHFPKIWSLFTDLFFTAKVTCLLRSAVGDKINTDGFRYIGERAELTLLNFWNAPNKHLLGEAETKIQNYYASVGNGGPTEA